MSTMIHPSSSYVLPLSVSVNSKSLIVQIKTLVTSLIPLLGFTLISKQICLQLTSKFNHFSPLPLPWSPHIRFTHLDNFINLFSILKVSNLVKIQLKSSLLRSKLFNGFPSHPEQKLKIHNALICSVCVQPIHLFLSNFSL